MPDHQPWRLLQIDDDEDDFVLTRTMLSQFQGRKVILEWSSTFEAGRQQLSSNHFDAVLVDYDLGQRTGIELIREFFALEYPGPFILFTGRGNYDVDVEAMQAGATLYITKTEATPLLLERSIRYAIERKQIETELRTRNEQLTHELDERRQMEHSLEIAKTEAVNERNRLQAVMEALPVGVAIVDSLGGHIQANKGYEQVWGEPRPEAHSVSDYMAYKAWWIDSQRPLEPEEWASARAVHQGETVVGQLLEIERFDGSHAYVMNSAAPVRDAGGQIVGSVVALQDISALRKAEEALQTSENRFSILFEKSAYAAALSKLPEGVLVDVNEEWVKIFGYTKIEAIGKTTLELNINPDTETRARILAQLQEQGSVRDHEAQLRTKSGEMRVFSLNIDLVDIGGEKYILNTAQDITERKRAEEDLQFHALLVENVSEAIISTDTELKIRSWNKAAEQIYGWQAGEVIGQPGAVILQTRFPDELNREELAHQLFEFGQWEGELVQKSKDGRWITVHASSIALKDSHGEVIGAVSISHDISERKRMEAELRKAEESSRSLIQHAPVGMYEIVFDLPRFKSVNDAMCRILGYTREELLEIDPINLLDPPGQAIFRERIKQLLAGSPIDDSVEYKVRAKDGREIDALLNVTINYDDGKPSSALVVADDITERKRHEVARQVEREKLAYLASFPEQNPNPVVEVDLDGSIRYANPSALRLFPNLKALGTAHPWLADWPAIVQSFRDEKRDALVRDLAVGDRTYQQAFYYFAQDAFIRIYAFDITERKQAELALLRAKQEWELTFNNVPDLIAILDGQHRIIRANAAMIQRLGVAPEQAVGLHCFEAVHGMTYPPGFCPHTRTLQDGQQHVEEVHEDRLGGDFLVSTTPLHDEQERVKGSVHVARDITRLKQVEEALRQAKTELELRVQERTAELEQANRTLEKEIGERRLAESALIKEQQRFNDVFDAMPVYLILLTSDYHVAFDNRFFRERFGESRGRPCYEFLFNRREPCEVCETYKVLKTMTPLEWEWTGPDGRNYYIYDFPFTDRDGSNLIMEVGIDITERKQAETELKMHRQHLQDLVQERTGRLEEMNAQLVTEISEREQAEAALRDSEARLNRAQEIAHLGSWELDLIDNHLSWSDEVYRIFGLETQEFGASYEAFLEAVHPDDRDRVDSAYSGSIREGKDSYDIEHRVVMRSTGEIRTIREKCEHIRDGNGRIIRSIGMVHDITDLKRAEKSLQEHMAKLERSNQALEDFAFIASHDLREPLRKVQAFGDRLKSRYIQELGDEGQDYIRRMQQAAARMQEMLDGLMMYSRVTTQGVAFMSVDLGQVVAEVLSDLEVRIKETGGQVEIGQLPVIQADPLQMRQLLQNLLGNALKFHRQGIPPIVKITCHLISGDRIQLVVEDNGIGFEEKFAGGMFKPFHRLHHRSVYEGTGMGLAICRKIAERHGGSISATGILEVGSTFTVTLPQDQARLEQTGSES
ncbi:MAG: PAS domain S-box protein [Chloroflexota bacterium]|nr:MAG: PAS domain S-box protein [Chloroflexota bacterium]